MKVDLHQTIQSNEEAIETVLIAIEAAGYKAGKDVELRWMQRIANCGMQRRKDMYFIE
jgi:enolase